MAARALSRFCWRGTFLARPLRPELEALGYKIAIFPVTALLAGVQAMTQVYQQFKDTGSSAQGSTPLYDFADLTRLMGFEDVWAFEKRYAETE